MVADIACHAGDLCSIPPVVPCPNVFLLWFLSHRRPIYLPGLVTIFIKLVFVYYSREYIGPTWRFILVIVSYAVSVRGSRERSNASQSEISTEFSLKDSFKLLDGISCFFRNAERFQKLY